MKKYNNKELSKIDLIEKLNQIKECNKQISSISILFSQSIIINRCNCNPTCSSLKSCISSHKLITPDISIFLTNQYILKFQNNSQSFIMYNNANNANEIRKLSNNKNNQLFLPYLKNKIYYQEKNAISCNKYYKIFITILNCLSQCEDYEDEKNKFFNFSFYDQDNWKKEVSSFYGHNLCCQLFTEELDNIIPYFQTNDTLVKF